MKQPAHSWPNPYVLASDGSHYDHYSLSLFSYKTNVIQCLGKSKFMGLPKDPNGPPQTSMFVACYNIGWSIYHNVEVETKRLSFKYR